MRAALAVIAVIAGVVQFAWPGVARAQKQSAVEVFDVVGPWRVLAVRSKRSQMQLRCTAYYKLDERLGRLYVASLTKDSNSEWEIAFRNETWPITLQSAATGQLVDLDTKAKISAGSPFYQDKLLTFPIGNSTQQIKKYEKSDSLRIEFKTARLNDKLVLPKTKAVIARINACHESNKG